MVICLLARHVQFPPVPGPFCLKDPVTPLAKAA